MTQLFAGSPDSGEFDVCVVGAGPVGLAVALECEKQGLTVLLVESGKARPRRQRGAHYSLATVLDTARHGAIEQIMRRALGGTTWVWGGRCVTFDDIDFEKRPYVSGPGWPLDHAQLKPWYALAADYLECGDPTFSLPTPSHWRALTGVTFNSIERLSRHAKIAPRLKRKLKQARRLTVSLDETAIGIKPAASGKAVAGVNTRSRHDRPLLRRARAYVLACGGLETTRLLLMLQQQRPECFGGNNGPLGHQYMGHLTGTIADLVLHDPVDFSIIGYQRDPHGVAVRRQWRIDDAIQRREGLLNIAFWASNALLSNPAHRSGTLSALYLGLRLPLARHLVSPGFRQANLSYSPKGIAPHIANIVGSPLRTIGELILLAKGRWIERSLKPPLLRSGSSRYGLRYHSEHNPCDASQVRLDDCMDERGLPRLLIDLRFSASDAASVVRAHDILDAALRASGKGYLVFHRPKEARTAHVLEQARDGYHQIGTARMGHSPQDSVVDKDCRVHGLANLFVVGSAVFATSGQAHPTLPAVALGVRLAAHLAQSVIRSTAQSHEFGKATPDMTQAAAMATTT